MIMKVAEAIETETVPVKQENTIVLPLGLLGFEQIKNFVLLTDPEAEPFLWLQVVNDPGLAFLVVSPFLVKADYRPDLSEQDVEFLDVASPEDVLMFNIVTVRPNGVSTVNLKGPIVLNRRTLVGKQIIPTNVADLPLKFPLPPAELN